MKTKNEQKEQNLVRVDLSATDDYQIPTNGYDLINWIEDELEKIPAALHDSAQVEIKPYMNGGELSYEVEIHYFRPATDREEKEQEKINKTRATRERAAELKLYRQLHKKYGATR